MKYKSINQDLFVKNRKKFTAKMKPNSVAIFLSNDQMPRNGDQNYFFRQNSDLFYLTGIDQEDTMLILYPDCPDPKFKEVIFVKETSEKIAVWEGKKHSLDETKQVSGVGNSMWNSEFKATIPLVMHWSDNCYLALNENDRFASDVPYNNLRFANDLKTTYPAHKFERSAPIISFLRSIKDDIEIEILQKACDITGETFRRVLKFIKPGVMEYEIEAEIMHEFLRQGATGYSYYPIIASGAGSCTLHYDKNDQKCNDGDVILLDFGCEYANYAADLTRTIPVNGKFTNRQRQVYDAVLRVMNASMKLLVPGVLLDEYHVEVGKLMQDELLQLGLITKEDVKNEDPMWPAYKKYFMHGTSHFLGLDVHDSGLRHKPIEEGMVFTCEPGIYIPEESIGIRIENDLVVSKSGPVDLMKNIPREADEIETLMNE